MEKIYFSISEAAKQVGMTSETLRHYDRIGLVKPSKVDKQTKYRYYSPEDLVRLNTIHALQQMDLPLQEIKRVLEYDDLSKIIAFLEQAEQKADEKIASLERGKAKIRLARGDYEKKLHGWQMPEGIGVKKLPERVILLADRVTQITVDDLWDYHRHFYKRLRPDQREKFAFADLAGLYCEGGEARYFGVCLRYERAEGLKTLPAGTSLCASCSEDNREATLERLLETASQEYGVSPSFLVQLVVVSGILNWRYEIQVFVGQ